MVIHRLAIRFGKLRPPLDCRARAVISAAIVGVRRAKSGQGLKTGKEMFLC